MYKLRDAATKCVQTAIKFPFAKFNVPPSSNVWCVASSPTDMVSGHNNIMATTASFNNRFLNKIFHTMTRYINIDKIYALIEYIYIQYIVIETYSLCTNIYTIHWY